MEVTNYYDKGKISGYNLKCVAILTMLIDHFAAVLLDYVSDQAYLGMRLVGRMAFPIFCFLLVQGYLHTRDVRRYAIRLVLFALVSEVAFDLAFYEGMEMGHQNVFFTLLIGLLTIHGMKKWERQPFLQVAAVLLGCAVAFLLNTDYGYLGVMQIVFFYNYRYFKGWRIVSILLINALIYDVFSLQSLEGLFHSFIRVAFASLSLLFIENYNGKRGKNMKYVFYVFYPAHLLLLALVRLILHKAF